MSLVGRHARGCFRGFARCLDGARPEIRGSIDTLRGLPSLNKDRIDFTERFLCDDLEIVAIPRGDDLEPRDADLGRAAGPGT